jgi:hypothetical protein
LIGCVIFKRRLSSQQHALWVCSHADSLVPDATRPVHEFIPIRAQTLTASTQTSQTPSARYSLPSFHPLLSHSSVAAPPVTGKRKRKQADTDVDSDGSALTDAEQPEAEADQDDDADTSDAEDDRAGAARTKASPAKRTKTVGNKDKTKRSVQINGTRATKTTRVPAGGRGRKAKQAKDASFDPDQLEKEARINADNPLFSQSHFYTFFFVS